MSLHAHIGSQIFDVTPFLDEVDIMMRLVKEIQECYDIQIKEVDLGEEWACITRKRSTQNHSTIL